MSNKTFRQITHHKRMVVIGSEEEFEKWINKLMGNKYVIISTLHEVGENKKQFRIVGEKDITD